jgi:hypothetical protein
VQREAARGSTLPASSGEAAARRGHRWRLVFAVALAAFIGVALLGVFDPHQAEVTAEGGGFRLTVDHPSRSRPGLPTHWAVEVETVDGGPLPETITLATTSAYFTLFDENGFDPDPSAASDDGELTYVEFDTVPGAARLSASFDGRIQPGWQRGRQAETWLLVEGEPVVGVRYETRLWL